MKEIRLKELPSFAKPRERAESVGVSNLADYELLAILLQTGSKDLDVLDLAKVVLSEIGDLSRLLDMTITELKEFRGIGNAKAISILSAVEIGKRAIASFPKKKIKGAKDIYYYANNLIGDQKQEILLAIFLDCTGKIIGKRIISVGTLNSTAFHPRDIIKWALKYSSYALIIAHNHPSGECMPSSEDIDSTNEIIYGCQAVGLHFVDHVILGKNSYYSFINHKCFKV